MNRDLETILQQRDVTNEAAIAQSNELQNLQQKISDLQRNFNDLKKAEINVKRQQTQLECELNFITANYEQKRTEQEASINNAAVKANEFLEVNKRNGEKLEEFDNSVKELKQNIEHLHITWDRNTNSVRVIITVFCVINAPA